MYKNFFGFQKSPFRITPDPRFLFLSQRHKAALAHLQYSVAGSSGFVLLTGEVGTGKTTLSRSIMNQLPDNVELALIFNPKLSSSELIESICDELEISYTPNAGLKNLFDALNNHLLNSYAQGRTTVLILDEAQNLSFELLEQIRLLSNLETASKKLLQIILIGQPELSVLIAKQELRQFSQRITARYHITPLNLKETEAYIRHRMAVAGRPDPIFTTSALRTVYNLSNGLPRIINKICDRALLGAYTLDTRKVTPKIVRQASKEVLDPKVSSALIKPMLMAMAGLMVGALIWFYLPWINWGVAELYSMLPSRTPPPISKRTAPPAPQKSVPDPAISHPVALANLEKSPSVPTDGNAKPAPKVTVAAVKKTPGKAISEKNRIETLKIAKPVVKAKAKPLKKPNKIESPKIIKPVVKAKIATPKIVKPVVKAKIATPKIAKPIVKAKTEPPKVTKPVVKAKIATPKFTKPVVLTKIEPPKFTKPDVLAKTETPKFTKPVVLTKIEPPKFTKPDVLAKTETPKLTKPDVLAKTEPPKFTKPDVLAKIESTTLTKPVVLAKIEAPQKKPVSNTLVSANSTEPFDKALDDILDLPAKIAEKIEEIEEIKQVKKTPSKALPVLANAETDVTMETLFTNRKYPTRSWVAYRTLFDLWNVDAPNLPKNLSCANINRTALRCLYRSGNWNTVRKRNFPFVMKILSPAQKPHFFVVVSIGEKSATILLGNKIVEMDLAKISPHWFGDFIILIRKTPMGKISIMPGSSGKDVLWLRKRLEIIEGEGFTTNRPEFFDNELQKRVRKFQHKNYLYQNGIVGTGTIVTLDLMKPDPERPVLQLVEHSPRTRN
jgi:type II secretory pathway predicted ATPase ExeA